MSIMAERRASPWTPAMVTAILGGLAVLASALLVGVGGVYVQVKAAQHAAELDRQTRDQKLEKITILVDGTKSAMLRKIAVLMRSTADKSGLAKDIKLADEAEREADEQEARVKAAIDAAKAKAPEVK
jgi:hypothetical protein